MFPEYQVAVFLSVVVGGIAGIVAGGGLFGVAIGIQVSAVMGLQWCWGRSVGREQEAERIRQFQVNR